MRANLLFICTDGQAANTVGAYGNSLVRTPYIDSLAARSVVFDRAYVTQPVCTASRSSIMTGLYPHTAGCTENNLALGPSVPVFPELIREGGHHCGYIGKWHLGDEVFRRNGFDEWVSIEDAYRSYYGPDRDRSHRSTYHHFLRRLGYEPDVVDEAGCGFFSRDFASRLPEEHTKAYFVGSEAVDFVNRNADEPFVLFVDFLEPHTPFFGPRNDEYRDVDVPLSMSIDDDLADKSLKTRMFALGYARHGHGGVDLSTESGWRKLIRRYWGLVSLVDSQIGRILGALADSPAAERTIVVFTSDHGEMMSGHGLLGKCVMFEEAIRVPLMISFPEYLKRERRIRPRRVCRPVSQIDLVPTLISALGLEAPEHLEGTSMLSSLSSRGQEVECCGPEDVVVEWNGMNSGFGDVLGDARILPDWRELADDITIKAALDDPVRTILTTEGLKYTWSHRGEDALYDLRSDPGELVNLIAEADASVVRDLRERIERWQARTLDPVVFG